MNKKKVHEVYLKQPSFLIIIKKIVKLDCTHKHTFEPVTC